MGDYRSIKDIMLDKSFCSTPDMGEYLDNDDIQKLASQIANGQDGGAYFLEAPFSTELGYHEAENVFVVSGRPTKITDGDTVDIQYSDIQDGGKSFVFPADGKKYSNVKEFLYQRHNLNSTTDNLPVRLLGINAPEVPHCGVTYINDNPKTIWVKFGDLISENTSTPTYNDYDCSDSYGVKNKSEFSFIYFNYTTEFYDNWHLDVAYNKQRKNDDKIEFLVQNAHTDKGIIEVYYEIIKKDIPKDSGDAELKKYAICWSHSPSVGREIDQYYNEAGTKSRDELNNKVKSTSEVEEVIFVLDGSTFKQQRDDIPDEYKSDSIRMSENPAYAFQYLWNQIQGIEKTYTRLGYNYFGQDYNKRSLGAMYLKMNHPTYGTVWINAAKYLAFKWNKWAKEQKETESDVYQILPAYASSPSIESNFNYNSAAFKMWTYDSESQVYIDALDQVVKDDRAQVQKDLTGSDLDQLKEYTVLIGDCLLMVPPTSIRLVSQTQSQRTSLIRAKGAITKTIPKVERIIEMQLYFNGETGINGIPYEQTTPSKTVLKYHMNGLRSLIAQFKFCPYLPIENKYINEVLNIEAVSLSSIQINTVPGFPRTVQATIRLLDFEYRQFMPEILPPNIDNKQDFTTNLFAQTIHFPVMRYYYQRAIQNGDAAVELNYNEDAYLEATLGQNTVIQPMKFNGPLIDFYIANEEFLKMRKQLKEALEKKPFETVVTYTDEEKKFLKEIAKIHSIVTKVLNKASDIIKKINSLSSVTLAAHHYGGRSVIDTPFSEYSVNDNYGIYATDDNKRLDPTDIYSKYMTEFAECMNTFFEYKDSFDMTMIKDHNVIFREQDYAGDGTDYKVLWGLKLVIDWSRASADLRNKLRQDYGKQFAIDTKYLLVDDAITIGYGAEFTDPNSKYGVTLLGLSSPFSSVGAKSKSTDIDYTNADTSLLYKLANDFGTITSDSTDNLEGNDLFSQNQALAKMKDNIDLETSKSMLFDKFPIYNCIIESVSVVYNNNFNKMSLSAMHGYVSQYIGASDTMIEVNIKTRDESIVSSLQTLPRQCAELLINYRKIMTCSPLRIDCEVARLAGINEVIIESIDINTVPNMPGLYNISLRLMSVDRTLRNREALKKIDDIDTSVTNNDSSIMTKNYFELKKRLKQVELYPDLELPMISDLEKLGYYFIRYKNQAGRLFPDADFYFVYQHAYTSEMLKESIIKFFTTSDYSQLQHQIVDNLTGGTKDITLSLSTEKDGSITKPAKLISKTQKDENGNEVEDEYDAKIKELYAQAEAVFKGDMKYADVKSKDITKAAENDLINKQLSLLSLQEILGASSYATYDFNHQIKISVKDNVAFKVAGTDINKGSIPIITADGTHDTEDANDVVGEVNNSLKHLIKNILKKPITDESGIMELVEYLAIDLLKCESLKYVQNVSTNNNTSTSSEDAAVADAYASASQTAISVPTASTASATGSTNSTASTSVSTSSSNVISNDLKDFIRNKLRIAMSSAATGKNSVLDYDKDDQIDNIANWIGQATVVQTDTKGNDTIVPNVLKAVNGQDISSYVIAEDGEDKYNGTVFGPFAIKRYNSKYMGTIINYPILNGNEGFLDPYYNKDMWNSFFAEEIADGKMNELTEDRSNDYIDIISDTSWDDKVSVATMNKSTIAMYRILLVWFYRLLDDKNKSLLPNSFFYLRNVSEALAKYSELETDSNTNFSYLANGMDPRTLIAKSANWLGKLTSYASDSIFGTNTKADAEKNDELLATYEKDAKNFQQMKKDLEGGLLPAKINLVCGLFATLGAIAIGEFNTPILTAVSNGNLSDYSDYLEQLKSSYLDYDKLSQVDIRMRRFFSYLDVEEYNYKTSWNKKIDSLKKYGLTSFIQRKYLEIADIPQIYLLHSFYDMVAHDMRGRMARAFPTYYMLLIDEGRDLGMWHLQDNFYDVSSISEFQVVKSRKIAADTASVMMTNLFGTFTSEDEDMKDEYQYTFKDAWNSIFSPRPYYLKEYNRKQNARDFNRAKMKPGARVHLRMGYEADASRIPIIFNGSVAEVETQDDMINIICQGDGVELANPDMFNAADVDDVADLKYTESMFGGLYGMFNNETTPRDILVNPLISSGTWIKSVIKDWSNSRFFNDNPFGIVHFGDKYYQTVFQNSGEMEQNIYEALNKPSWGYAGEANFNESLWAMEEAPKIRVGLEGKKSYWDLMNIAASVSPEYIAAVVPFQLRSSVFYGAPRYYCAYDYERTAEGKVIEKRKPFQQYHVYTSYSDIIANKIAASEKDIRTCAVGIYQGNGWLETTNQSVGPMWLDIDIYPEKQKMTTINCDFTHKSFNIPFTIPIASKVAETFTEDAYKVAWRATANGLKNTVKDMYTGELIVMGDPTVKPYDKMFVYDTYLDIQGTFDVEAVVHTFSVDTGFTTSISPDCVVAVDDKYEKIAHNAMLTAIKPALMSSLTVTLLSQRFANITRSIFFASAQSIKSGAEYASKVANSAKTLMGAEDIAAYGGMAEKVLGEVAPIFGATASDFVIYSSIYKLTQAYKSLPTSHNLNNGADLIKFLNDILKQDKAISALDPTKLKAELETALAETSNANTAAREKLAAAISNVDSYISTYAKTAESSSFSISYDFISEIIKEVPDGKMTELTESVEYLKKLESTGIMSNSKSFEEAMNHLIKIAKNTDNLTETGAVLKEAATLDTLIFGKTATALESFATFGETLAEVNTVAKGAGAIKAFLSSNIMWLAAQIILTKHVEEYIERKLKNLQVMTVFPVMKNNLVMTAGLDGNKGSVFDSPTYNQPGFIEEMAANFFDRKYGSVLPVIMDCLMDTSDMKEIVNNYKRNSSYQNGSLEVLQDSYSNKLLNATTMQDVKGIEAYKEMFLVPRVASATSDDAKVAFANYKLVDIDNPVNYSIIDNELVYIFIDKDIRQFNDPETPDRQVLLFAAQQKINTTDSTGNAIDTFDIQVKTSTNGTKDLIVKGKRIEQGGNECAIFDIPLLRTDAVSVLTYIVKETITSIQTDAFSPNSTLNELHKHNIIIHNATRVNDKKSWYCTGFSFTIQVKDYDEFGNILKRLHDQQPVIKNDDGTVVKAWNYKEDTTMGDNTYRIMVMPPL